jgi:Domain of unknown function (DUF4249)
MLLNYMPTKYKFLPITLLACSSFLWSCTKPVTINLPPDENRLVVEAYLIPQKRFAVALQTSTGISSTQPVQLVSRALVTITHNGIIDTLRNLPYIDSANGRVYNYSSPVIMGNDYVNTYTLSVFDSTNGKTYTATTKLLVPVPIDSVNHTVNISNEVSIGLKFTDPAAASNYYRRFVFTNEINPEGNANFRFTDKLFNGEAFSVFTRFSFKRGDTVTVRLYNLNQVHFEFLESINTAEDAAGNPLSQPVFAKGNISGDALGIFTGLSYAERKYIVP